VSEPVLAPAVNVLTKLAGIRKSLGGWLQHDTATSSDRTYLSDVAFRARITAELVEHRLEWYCDVLAESKLSRGASQKFGAYCRLRCHIVDIESGAALPPLVSSGAGSSWSAKWAAREAKEQAIRDFWLDVLLVATGPDPNAVDQIRSVVERRLRDQLAEAREAQLLALNAANVDDNVMAAAARLRELSDDDARAEQRIQANFDAFGYGAKRCDALAKAQLASALTRAADELKIAALWRTS